MPAFLLSSSVTLNESSIFIDRYFKKQVASTNNEPIQFKQAFWVVNEGCVEIATGAYFVAVKATNLFAAFVEPTVKLPV